MLRSLLRKRQWECREASVRGVYRRKNNEDANDNEILRCNEWMAGVRSADYDMKIRLVILGIKVPVGQAGSTGGAEDTLVEGKRMTCDTFDFEHVTFEFSSVIHVELPRRKYKFGFGA